MPPSDSSLESKLRYVNRLLAALTLQAGGELRIPMKYLRLVESENERQALMEDSNFDTEELVLRFFTKHAAFYPIEPEPCLSTNTPSSPKTLQVPQSQPVAPPRKPMTDEELAKVERTIKAKRVALRMKREPAQEELLTILEENSPN